MSTIVLKGKAVAPWRRLRSTATETTVIITTLMVFGAAHVIGCSHIERAYASRNPVEIPSHTLSAD